MVDTSEREMVRKTDEEVRAERFTSLQPTYEDTVPNEEEYDSEFED